MPCVRDLTVMSLGHAGLRVQAPGFSLVMDPWRSSEGAFLGAWHQLPDNGHLAPQTWTSTDWVTVSHEHLDHMDGSVLSALAPATRVVIPRYPSTVLKDRLTRMGVDRVVEVSAWERLALDDGGSWLTVIPEKSPMCHDSAFLVVSGGHSILHLNDARLTAAQGRQADTCRIEPTVDSQHLPVDVTCRRAAQETNGRGDFFRRAVAPQRYPVVIVGTNGRAVHQFGHRRIDRPRCDGVDANAHRAEFGRLLLGQLDHAGLARAVGHPQGAGAQA